MTTYRTISDTEVAVDAPITQPLMQALKDNPIAITEGAENAPRITAAGLSNVEAGDFFLVGDISASQSTGGEETKSLTYTVAKAGTYRVKIGAVKRFNTTYSSSSHKADFYVEGAVVFSTGTYSSGSTTAVVATQSVTLAAGDEIYVKIDMITGTTTNAKATFVLGGVADNAAMSGQFVTQDINNIDPYVQGQIGAF